MHRGVLIQLFHRRQVLVKCRAEQCQLCHRHHLICRRIYLRYIDYLLLQARLQSKLRLYPHYFRVCLYIVLQMQHIIHQEFQPNYQA